MAVILALAAAFLFAAGTVLQQRIAAEQPDEEALRPAFLIRLARHPVWLLGIALDGLGFVCQAAALGVGRLVVVQPLLATTVVFALPLGVWLSRQRIGGRQVLAAIAVTSGLAAFLVLSHPSGGQEDAGIRAWLVAAAITVAITGTLVAVGARQPGPLKATLLGSAAGILFGVGAALTKATVDRLDDGVIAVVADWHLYALILVGVVSMMLSQASLQTGELAPAVATQMTLDPIASLLLGTLLLQERLHETRVGIAVSLMALGAMLAGLIVLAARQEQAERPL